MSSINVQISSLEQRQELQLALSPVNLRPAIHKTLPSVRDCLTIEQPMRWATPSVDTSLMWETGCLPLLPPSLLREGHKARIAVG
jgi:hypothetical protein